jgi:hypothetical protein
LAVLSSSLEIVLLQGIFHEKRRKKKEKVSEVQKYIYVYMLRLLENGKEKKTLRNTKE